MKDMTSVAKTMMTDEEKAELEAQMKGGKTPLASPQPTPLTEHPHVDPTSINHEPAPQNTAPTSSPTSEKPAASASTAATTTGPDGKPTAADGTSSPPHEAADPRRRAKMTPEQRAQLLEVERERRQAMEARVKALTDKLHERIRPFVDATTEDEVKAFEKRIRSEADDLKLESFGVELLHTIGSMYINKGTSYLKSKTFLGLGGFWSRVKEKGTLAKDAWGVIGSALGAQNTMIEIQRLEEKGDLTDEQKRQLEMDATGKVRSV